MTDDTLSNASGLALADSNWLDTHFRAMQPEYEEALRWVGLQRGWRVLDAGAGSGSYLPLLAELVGPHGEVCALDLDAEHVARIQNVAAQGEFAAPVTARQGTLTQLPYEDKTFDAVWCANVSQYLTDDELERALTEFVRVTKPGGLVAIKDADLSGNQIQPGPPDLFSRLYRVAVMGHYLEVMGCFRTSNLAAWLRKSGLLDVAQRHFAMVRTQPLRPVERKLLADWFRFDAQLLRELNGPQEDLAAWTRHADVASPDCPLNSPDFMFREMQIVFVGKVPNP